MRSSLFEDTSLRLMIIIILLCNCERFEPRSHFKNASPFIFPPPFQKISVHPDDQTQPTFEVI